MAAEVLLARSEISDDDIEWIVSGKNNKKKDDGRAIGKGVINGGLTQVGIVGVWGDGDEVRSSRNLEGGMGYACVADEYVGRCVRPYSSMLSYSVRGVVRRSWMRRGSLMLWGCTRVCWSG